ncbi:MAG: S8 family serine peptidase [Actinobacteria bacterium]|nr:S8 family serine peptidase [Actinomycetota bacterium]
MIRRSVTLALATLVASALVAPTTSAAPAPSEPARSVVVVSEQGAEAAERAVREAGGEVRSRIDMIGSVVATLDPTEIERLDKAPGISVTPDYALTVEDADYSGAPASTYADSVGATQMWDRGTRGEGIGVALLDTGVAAHPDLTDRVVASADLTSEGTFSDSYGHGTFLAGLIAGNGASSKGRFTGVAPDAHLMSVKVAGADGATTLGQVLYGLQLIDSSKDRYNIKVVTLALAGPAVSGPDPLVLAVERLWADGLVVVAAAGNTGPESGSIASPAVDPYVMTVGSTDEQGTPAVADDTIPVWSARGPSVYSKAKPDVVAPGKSLVSLRAPGSTADVENAQARIGHGYFRGSGTSMSAAVAAGAAALLLQSRPGLTPDQVKGALMGTAGSVAETDRNATGAGAIDVAAASASDASAANQDLPPLPRGARALAPSDPVDGAKRTSFDWFSDPEGGEARWLARRWAGEEWSARRWAARRWAARRWAGADWSARRWAARRWAGEQWAADGWAARRWAGADWSARRWAGTDWAAIGWATAGWR